MLIVRLHEAIADYQRRTGKRLTLKGLAHQLGMGESTLRGIANAHNSTTLLTVEKIARVLGTSALGMLDELPNVDRADGVARPTCPTETSNPGKSAKKTKKKREDGVGWPSDREGAKA